MENQTEQLNNQAEEKRNNPEDAALLEAENKIKSLAFKEQPARESFRQELKTKILTARQKSSMKFWQVKFMVPAVAFAFVLAFIFGAVYFKANVPGIALLNSNNQAKENLPKSAAVLVSLNTAGSARFSFNPAKPAFAEANETKPVVTPVLSGEKAELKDLANLADFEKDAVKFSDEQKKALEENNFFLAKNNLTGAQDGFGNTDDFVDIYSTLKGSNLIYDRKPENAVFISSDLGLHLYHILIDRSFQKLEETKMQPVLKDMTRILFEDSINKYDRAADPVLKDSYKRLAVYFLVPLVILDAADKPGAKELQPGDFPTYAEFLDAQTKQQEDLAKSNLNFSLTEKKYDGFVLSDEIYNIASAELGLIAAAKDVTASPLFTPERPDFLNDYTQFVPRSHYTKNNILKSYFIAMMWYGRMGFALKSPALTRDALLITGQVNSLQVNGEALANKLSDMADVIDFFVGQSDDLTPAQYTQEMKKIYGDNVAPEALVKDENLQKFITGAVTDLPSPGILSEVIDITGRNVSKEDLLKETMQFRFMGQRFTPDAYVLNKLTQGYEAPDPETGQKLPSMATALEPLSVIAPDNQTVKKYFSEWVAQKAPNSDKIIAKVSGQLTAEFSKYNPGIWTQNIYWSWLNSFRSLLGNYGQGYPFFMKSESWQDKNLGTTLGSYTELKHDTLLYAKQSYAEMGAGGPEIREIPAAPKGYVEPDLVFWNKLSDLAEITRNGLKRRNMFPEEFDNKYQIFIDDVAFFRGIVGQELKNEKISDDDFEKLRLISNSLEDVVSALPGEELTTKEKRAGIVADIHTDGYLGQILYEATSKPNLIYTAVKDVNGTRLTVGAVYDHYEFVTPLEKRLTDEDWQAKVYENSAPLPAEDAWTTAIKK